MRAVLLFSCLVLGQAKDKDPQPAPPVGAIMDQIVMPFQNLAVAKVDEAMDTRAASAWALWDLLNGLKQQRAAGAAKLEPDLGIVEAWLRLMMHLNTGELTRFGKKPYPSDADFQWAAKEAEKGLASYFASVKPAEDLLSKKHRGRAENLMSRALNRMITFRLKPSFNGQAEIPPFAPGGESSYINKARMNKTSDRYSFPPWPDGR